MSEKLSLNVFGDSRIVKLTGDAAASDTKNKSTENALVVTVSDVRKVVIKTTPDSKGPVATSKTLDDLKVTTTKSVGYKLKQPDSLTPPGSPPASPTPPSLQKRRDASEMSGTPPSQGTAKIRIIRHSDESDTDDASATKQASERKVCTITGSGKPDVDTAQQVFQQVAHIPLPASPRKVAGSTITVFNSEQSAERYPAHPNEGSVTESRAMGSHGDHYQGHFNAQAAIPDFYPTFRSQDASHRPADQRPRQPLNQQRPPFEHGRFPRPMRPNDPRMEARHRVPHGSAQAWDTPRSDMPRQQRPRLGAPSHQPTTSPGLLDPPMPGHPPTRSSRPWGPPAAAHQPMQRPGPPAPGHQTGQRPGPPGPPARGYQSGQRPGPPAPGQQPAHPQGPPGRPRVGPLLPTPLSPPSNQSQFRPNQRMSSQSSSSPRLPPPGFNTRPMPPRFPPFGSPPLQPPPAPPGFMGLSKPATTSQPDAGRGYGESDMDYSDIDASIDETCRSYSPEICDVDYTKFNNLSQEDNKKSLTSQLMSNQHFGDKRSKKPYNESRVVTRPPGKQSEKSKTDSRSVVMKTASDSKVDSKASPSQEAMDTSEEAKVDVKDIVSKAKRKQMMLLESLRKVEGPMPKPVDFDDLVLSVNISKDEQKKHKASKIKTEEVVHSPDFTGYREEVESSPSTSDKTSTTLSVSPVKPIVAVDYGSDSDEHAEQEKSEETDKVTKNLEEGQPPATESETPQASFAGDVSEQAPQSRRAAAPVYAAPRQRRLSPKSENGNTRAWSQHASGDAGGFRGGSDYESQYPGLSQQPSGHRPFASKYRNENTGHQSQTPFANRQQAAASHTNHPDFQNPGRREQQGDHNALNFQNNAPDNLREPPGDYHDDASQFQDSAPNNQMEQPHRPFQTKYKSASGIKFHVKSSSALLEAKTPFLQQMRSGRSKDGEETNTQRFNSNKEENKRSRLSEHKSQRWAGPKSTPRRSLGAGGMGPWNEEFKFESPDSPSSQSDANDSSASGSSSTPFARGYDMSRYKRQNTGKSDKPFERKARSSPKKRNAHPEPTWPSRTYCNGELGLHNVVIAGDSITRAMKEAAPTREIHVVAAPGCTSYAPQLVS